MFKRLLFGNEEAKLQFKTSTTAGIARLYSDPNISASDSLYWRSYLQLFDSPTDVFSLVAVSDIRRALATYPENVSTLVQVLTKHLESLQHDAYFSHPPAEASTRASIVGGALTAGRASNVADWIPGRAARAAQGTDVDSRDRLREALNCCRILARVLPVIMEGDHDDRCNTQADGTSNHSGSLSTDDFERQLLWSADHHDGDEGSLLGTPSNDRAPGDEQDTQFVIAEGDDEDDDERPEGDPLGATNGGSQVNVEKKLTEGKMGPTLGERLTSTAVNLLFYAGFTLPWTDEQVSLPSSAPVAASRTHFTIWEKGIGSSVDLPGLTKQHEANRVEVLRLLLVLLSKSIYVPAHLQTSTDNLSLHHICASLGRSIVLPLLCSLINVSVVRIKAEGWLGGLASLPAGLVKDRLASGTEDVRQSTTMLSLQILNVLLGYEAPTAGADLDAASSLTPSLDTQRPPLGASASSQSVQSVRGAGLQNADRPANMFRLYLSKLHRQSDFLLLSEGIFAILGQRLSPASLFSPASAATDTSAAGPHIPEAMLFLWLLLQHNAKFRTFLLDDSLRSPQLLSHLLYHALNNKDSAARQGLVRLAVFVLQDISSERCFAVNVCKAGSGVKARITGGQRWGVAAGGGPSLPTVGAASSANQSQASTGADILVQSVYSLMASTKSALSALYPPLIITITNLSPFFKNLSILSSSRLVALLSSFSSPSFLLADEGNPRLIYYLLEAINLTIQHGFNRNPNLVYALVRNHRQVERLANFTLRRGIADMRRARKRAGVVESSLGSLPSESVGEKTDSHEVLDDTLPSGETDENVDAAAEAPSSEKARGKMRRTSVSSEGTRGVGAGGSTEYVEDEEDRLVAGFNEEELWYAASTIGRSGFVPTQAWVTSWQKGLPLDTLQVMLLELVPRVQELCSSISSKSDADDRVLAFLREQSLVDVLPTPEPIQPRPFRGTPQVSIWLLSYLWGLIYLGSSLPFGLFVGSNARLFQLRVQDGNAGPRREQMALLNVGNMVFGGLSQALGLGQQQQQPSQSSSSYLAQSRNTAPTPPPPSSS